VRRELLCGSPRRVAEGSWDVGKKAGPSSSDEGPSVVFLGGKRRRISRDWRGKEASSSDESDGEDNGAC